MSTTIKRVALVAVAALGLGVVSVAPSTAMTFSDSLVLSSATATQLTSETVTATSATATLTFLSSHADDSMSVVATLVSAPAGNTALPYLMLAETTTSEAKQGTTVLTTDSNAGVAAGNVITVAGKGATLPANISAKFKVYLNAPAKVGAYVVKITPAVVTGGGTLAGSAQTLTITVSQNSATDPVVASATTYLNDGETLSATADATNVTASKSIATSTLANTAAAVITTVLKNAAAKTISDSYTVTIAGPGILGAGAFGTGTTVDHSTVKPTGRALTVKNGDVVGVFPDGNSGVATITIGSSTGIVLATKTVTFYGDAAKITAASNALTTGSVAKVGTALDLLKFNVYDASGVEVKTGTYYVVSDNTAIANATAYTSFTATYNATKGYFTAPVTGVAKGTANLYITNRASATATTPTTEVKSNSVAIRVGSATAASVSVTTDKSSYAPGEKATISVTIKDADGLVVPSGDYNNIFATGGITASYTLGAGSDTTTVTNFAGSWATVDGVYAYTVYMPVTEGDVKFSWTTGTGLATANQAVAGSLTVAVSSAATSAAIDAANEAAQAASDATDAALAAADAADAATTKAQEAVDAVATLSAQVSKLITALKAQITTLTNLVIKIQKKVKA